MRAGPVRSVLCTSGGIHGSVVLDRLLVASESIRVVGLVESSRILRAGYSPLRGAYRQIRISGIRYALYLWTATTLADLLQTLAGPGSVAAVARRRGIPRIVTRDINGPAERRFLQHLRPDLLISAFFNQRIGRPAFTLPSLGAINIHPSLLPDYRGVDPVFFARLRGAPSVGVTVHRIDEDWDTGAILCAEKRPVIPDESVLCTSVRLFRRGAELVVQHIGAIADAAPGTPQPRIGTYDSWPLPGQVAALRDGGTALVRAVDLGAIAAGRWSRD